MKKTEQLATAGDDAFAREVISCDLNDMKKEYEDQASFQTKLKHFSSTLDPLAEQVTTECKVLLSQHKARAKAGKLRK